MRMRDLKSVLQTAVTCVGGWLGWFLGGFDGLMKALCLFMLLDYMTGVMCAFAERKLSSAVGFRGICRKALILLLVGAAQLIDANVTGTAVLRSAVILFYLANEGVSVTENAARLGLPIPDRLKQALSQLNSEKEDK